MAKTNNKPGPKPGATKKYGPRKEYHFRLSSTALPGEAMSISDAFDAVSEQYGGDSILINHVLRLFPDIAQKLEGETNNA
jgi:hypothetical protein